MTSCEDLHPFIDGELEPDAAAAFRRHLGTCPRCPLALEHFVLLDTLAQERLGGSRATPPEAQSASRRAAAPPRPDELAARRRQRRLAAIGFSAAAGLALFVGVFRQPSSDPGALVAAMRFRTTQGRLAYPGFDTHRPLVRDRGGTSVTSESTRREAILAELEARGDHHGLAAAFIVEGKYDQAERYLARAAPSVGVRVDRAVVAIERNEPHTALSLLDGVLATQPRHSQALWNRALALQLRGSPAEAASVFRKVAALGEPGWAEEAASRAEQLVTSPR